MKALILPTNNKSLLSADNHKHHLPLNSKLNTRIKDQINYLKNAGVDELLIIQGIGHDQLADFLINSDGLQIKIKIIRNPFQFQNADSLIALWMAISEINDEVLIINMANLLQEGLLELFFEYEGGTSCFVVNSGINCENNDNKVINQDQGIVEIGDNKYLKHIIFSDSISLCTFRQSGLALIKESIEEEIRTEDANKKGFVSAIYRFLRKEHMVCKIKSFDICDIYKIYTDSPRNTLKAAANASEHIDKSQGHGNLRIINTSIE